MPPSKPRTFKTKNDDFDTPLGGSSDTLTRMNPLPRRETMPLMLSTWSFGQRGNAAAWPGLAAGGSALDAVERACIAVEDDPEVDSVGTGGLPDALGEVSLDGCIMLSPSQRGSVCAVRGYPNPVSIARRVMECTPHVLLAGAGAERFAADEGFTRRDLLTEATRAKWEAWRARPHVEDQSRDRSLADLRPVDRDGSGRLFGAEPPDTPEPPDVNSSGADAPGAGAGGDDESRWSHHDTIGTLALDARGVPAGACSTSGTPYKQPGRVGDSPIIGHGLYVDPAAGAATATGTGELVMSVCGSFLAVELLRAGRSPEEAARAVLERILGHFTLRPQDQVALIVLRADGAWAAGALRPGFRAAVRTSDRDEVIPPCFTLVE